jgi:hypothetical protein
MAVQRRVNWISQQRVDCPDMRAVESAASNDFDQLIQAFVTGSTRTYVIRGFNILMAGAIGGAASGLQLNVDPGALLHTTSSQSGTILMVPTGTLPQQLNSATNTIVDGSFAPSAINYVSIEYERFIDDTTSAQVYIWNPTTNNETTKNAPRAQILRYRIKITTATPAATYLPIATVITDSGNNVVSITDDRPLIGRLGSGGITPNPFNIYNWPQGRSENPSTSTSNSIDPFSGGDKAIQNLKDWMDAVMSSIQEIKGTTYWYSASSSGSLETLREDLANTVITGRGAIAHGVLPSDGVTPTAAGQINWDQDINIRVVGSLLTYKLTSNPATTNVTLADDQVAYVTLVRGIVVSPNLIFTNGIPQITSVGAISWTGPLQAGDYLKLGSDTDAGYYEILSVDSLTQVTLTTNYAGADTGPAGAKAKYAFGTYQSAVVPSGQRDIFITSRALVPAGQDVFWLFMRNDNAGAQPRVYIRFLGVELDQGEERDVSDTTSKELLMYIGSASEYTYQPLYVSALNPGSLAQISNITIGAASTITSNQYFFINSSGNYRENYVWFKKDGIGTDPAPAGTDFGIEVDITTGQTATQVASALAAALNASLPNDYYATSGVGTVQVTNTSAGTSVAPLNFNVGAPFAITNVQTGTGTGNFVIRDGVGSIDGDNLTLAIKRLDMAIGQIAEAADAPDYDENVDIVASGATPPTSLNGPIAPGAQITLPNNSRFGSLPQKYPVGKGALEVYLNGQYLRLGVDWIEVGAPLTQSNQIQIQQTLVVGDELEFRIDTGGGGGGGGGGSMGPPGPPGPAGPSGHDAAGGPVAISTKSSNYTVLLGDNVLLANAAGGAITFSLPTAASAVGHVFYFKKIDSTANAMTIMANGVELIDGFNTQNTTVQYTAFTLITDGTSWYIF